MVAHQIDGDRVQVGTGRELTPSLESRERAAIELEKPDENFLSQVLHELRRIVRCDARRSFRLRPKRSQNGDTNTRPEASDELPPQRIVRTSLDEALDEVTVGKALQVYHVALLGEHLGLRSRL